MRETTGAGARQPRERKRVEMARESRCSVHRTGHGASLRKASSVASKMAMWQNKDKTGSAAGAGAKEETAWLKHQGPITCLKHMGGNKFSTTACDGRLVLWSA